LQQRGDGVRVVDFLLRGFLGLRGHG
jgi:hypothetical protein